MTIGTRYFLTWRFTRNCVPPCSTQSCKLYRYRACPLITQSERYLQPRIGCTLQDIMPTFEHKKIMERLNALDELPSNQEEIVTWVKADAHIEFLKNNEEHGISP